MKRVLGFIKLICLAAVLSTSVVGATYVYGLIEPTIEVRQVGVPVPVPRKEPTFDELLTKVPKAYGVSPILAQAIVERESGGKRDAIRFEPGQLGRAAKITRDPEQQRMFASSHCAFQVMGWHAPTYGISWSDLYRPEVCAEVAMTILKNCIDRNKSASKVKNIHGALTCYNGSEKYADAVLSRLGEKLIEQML